jgi:hypothetical protein
MRNLNALCGVAVLLTTLAFAHLLHHYVINAGHGDLAFWAMFSLAVIVVIFSFVGGCLLLRRSR